MPNDRPKPDAHERTPRGEAPGEGSSGKARGMYKDAVVAKAAELKAGARVLVKKTHGALRGDDPERIEAECAYLTGILRPGPAVVPNHVIQGFAAAGVAAGLLAFEGPIMRFTRGHMDVDGGVFQQLWRSVFPRSDVTRAVDTFMDHVPGWSVPGGTFHRIHHGHDLEALVRIMNDHNVEGALQWVNHVALRDFWTPHGVPFLPSGSGTVYEWLVNAGFSKATAANLLTINAAEFFAGLSALRFAVMVYRGVKHVQKNAAIKEYLAEGDRRAAAGNAEGADEAFRKAHDISGKDAKIGLQVAMRQMAAASDADPETADELYRNAYSRACGVLTGSLTKGTDTMQYQGGTLVSIRGIAGYVLAAALRGEPGGNASRQLPSALLRDSISAFRNTATDLRSQTRLYGNRQISAALNDLLALELSTHVGGTQGPDSPLAIRNNLMAALHPESDPNNATGHLLDLLIKGIDRRYPQRENYAA